MTKLKNLSLQLVTALLFAACAGSMLCKGSEMEFSAGLAALIAMAVVMIAEPAWWMPVEIALVVAMAFVNAPPIWDSFCKLFLKKGRHRNIM